jgi:hypothetical protein
MLGRGAGRSIAQRIFSRLGDIFTQPWTTPYDNVDKTSTKECTMARAGVVGGQGIVGPGGGILPRSPFPNLAEIGTFGSWDDFRTAIGNAPKDSHGRPVADLPPGTSFKIQLDGGKLGVGHDLEDFNKNSPFTAETKTIGKHTYLVVTAKTNQKPFQSDVLSFTSRVVAPGAKVEKYKFDLVDGLHVMMG